MEIPLKRARLVDETTYENVLNLSLNATAENSGQRAPSKRSFDSPPMATAATNESVGGMRAKFQNWVLETYRDSSKTKTITARKYDRIVKTLAGEIKNCAENSKFRFWMRCKGFKLDATKTTNENGEIRSLLVQDKKGDETKYKKVAIVEDFFDIIYKVHVNEGARGIKHAGQKRTHRTITETYAFLPREAVTRFLMCCVECQRRSTVDERKHSPASLSNDSTNTSTNYEAVAAYTEPSNYVRHYSAKVCDDDWIRKLTPSADIENNNNRSTETTSAEPYNFSLKISPTETNIGSHASKRKRKVTRKIVRLSDEMLESEADVHSATDEFVTNTTTSAGCYANDASAGQTTTSDCRKSVLECTDDVTPFVAKICQLLYNPVKHSLETSSEKLDETLPEEDILEQTAVNLLLKARKLEGLKDGLTDDERQQLVSKVYDCRITSFLLNYTADLMLKLIVAEETKKFQIPVTLEEKTNVMI